MPKRASTVAKPTRTKPSRSALPEWQVELAGRSPVFAELIRRDSRVGSRLHSLSALWEAAGKPDHLEPRAYLATAIFHHAESLARAKAHPDPDMIRIVGTMESEDRGGAGMFADWEVAVWYAHQIDEDNIGVDEALNLTEG